MKNAKIFQYVTSQLWAISDAGMEQMMASIHSGEMEARSVSAGSQTHGAIAIIPIRGPIAHRQGMFTEFFGGTSYEQINNMLSMVEADPNIKTVLYDFDTPGGEVMGCDETAARMFALRGSKRQIAMVNGDCCSGGYYLASQADEIVSIPSGETGSIGVVWPHIDRTAQLEKEGVKITIFKAGRLKWSGNAYEPMAEEFAAKRKARVDDAYDLFVKAVARGRGATPAAVRNGFGEGDVLVAKAAKAAGLIDRIATMDETIARLIGRKVSVSGGARAEVTESEDGRYLSASVELPEGVTSAEVVVSIDEADRLRRMERF